MSREIPGKTRIKLALILADAMPDLDVKPEDIAEAKGWHRSNGHWSNDSYRWEAFARTKDTGIPVVFGSHDTMTACAHRGVTVSRGSSGKSIKNIEVHAKAK